MQLTSQAWHTSPAWRVAFRTAWLFQDDNRNDYIKLVPMMQVKAIATAAHSTFFTLSGASVYSPYVGDAEREVRSVFGQARAAAPSVLFLDEVQLLVSACVSAQLLWREVNCNMRRWMLSWDHEELAQAAAGASRLASLPPCSTYPCGPVPVLS